jgi:hypothetical protein
MTEVIHGLVSGLIWSAIYGTCLIAATAAVTAALPARARVRRRAPATTQAPGESSICTKARQEALADRRADVRRHVRPSRVNLRAVARTGAGSAVGLPKAPAQGAGPAPANPDRPSG